jgi:hypothetical protein
MAELVTVQGQTYKKRNPLGAWGLVFLTLGVYGFVWYFKINDEARRFLGDESIKPGIALLAVLLGWVIIVPPFISYYRTGERVRRMEEVARIQQQVSPAIGLLAALVMAVHVLYLQEHLNKVWGAYQGAPAAPAAPAPA